MKSRIPYAIAALVAAGALQHAAAQATSDDPASEAPTVPYVPAWIPKKDSAPDTHTYVQEPSASVSSSTGLDGELATSIAEQINADPAMKGAKITVQPDEDHKIVLTGAARNRQQVERAYQIATDHAGGSSMVVNVIQDSQI